MASKRPAAASSLGDPPMKRPAAAAANNAALPRTAAAKAKAKAKATGAPLKKPAAAAPKKRLKFAFHAKSVEEEKKLLLKELDTLARCRAGEDFGSDFDERETAEDLFCELQYSSSPEARQDREIALASVSVFGVSLEYFSEELRNDEEVCLASLHSNCCGLDFASESLRKNKDFCIKACGKYGTSLYHLGAEWRSDRDVVAAAVENDGGVLDLASQALRADRDIVLTAVRRWGFALGHADARLRGDREVVMAAVRQHGDALEVANKAFRKDREVVLEAVRQTGTALSIAAPPFRADREIVLAAVKQWPLSLADASKALRGDKDFVLLAARHSSNWGHGKDPRKAPEQVFREVSAPLKSQIRQDEFIKACFSSLAVPGQQAPVLSATLTRVGDDHTGKTYECQATMLSGRSFSCSIPDLARPRPSVNDLANKLLSELQKHTEDDSLTHVFINFATDSGDSVPVTAWDWEKPLANFASSG